MKKDSILFVTPPYNSMSKGTEYVKHITNRSPSLGLLILAAEVRKHGYQPSILECDVFGLDAEESAKRIIEQRPDFVGLTLFTVGVSSATKIAEIIKKEAPEISVIVGGPHMSSLGKQTMERIEVFDYAIIGEGETSLLNFLDTINKGGPLSTVDGLIWREDGKLRVNNPFMGMVNLEELSMPAWDLLEGYPKSYPPAIFDYPRGPVATFAASRGCPFHCKFCDNATFGRKARYYTATQVVDTMEHLRDTYGIRHLQFIDDMFMSSKSRVKEICELMIERKTKMTWSCSSRVDSIKPDQLALMKKAGCWEIGFGLESGSDTLLKKMGKAVRIEKSIRAVTWAKEAGMRTKGLFILGYPGENLETIAETKAFVKAMPLTLMNLSKFTPYPGSPVYEQLYGTNMLDDDWDKMNSMNFLWESDEISNEELDRQYRQILKEFYKHFHIGVYYTKLSIKNPMHLIRIIRFGLGFLRASLANKFFNKEINTTPAEPS